VVKQVVGVEKVREAISTTIDELLATLKPELRQKDQLESYLRTAQEFKEEVSKEAPSKAILARLLSSLSLLADVDGVLGLGDRAFDLYQKVAPHIHVLTGYVSRLVP
jgi:hypothetical protein